VTHADLQAYLARPETQKQLRIVVAGVLGRRANRQNVHDLAVDAQVQDSSTGVLGQRAVPCP
jgi:hypothetical protein